MTRHWSDAIAEKRACGDAVKWLLTQPDAATAWQECRRGDWMLWLLGKQAGEPGSDTRRPLVLAACACARLALPYIQAGEGRPLLAIETAEQWARGDAGAPTIGAVREAAAAAADAYAYAYAADAADAAAAAAYAAYAADAAAYAAYAAYAAAAYAAYAADAARSKVLAQCADVVRKFYPEPPEIA